MEGIYVGGYFWWNGLEDCLINPKLLEASLRSAFNGEAGLPH